MNKEELEEKINNLSDELLLVNNKLKKLEEKETIFIQEPIKLLKDQRGKLENEIKKYKEYKKSLS